MMQEISKVQEALDRHVNDVPNEMSNNVAEDSDLKDCILLAALDVSQEDAPIACK
jgi:hypothetical protein